VDVTVEHLVPGIQLTIFEVIWLTEGLEQIVYRATGSGFHIRIAVSDGMSAYDRDACEHLMLEVLTAAGEMGISLRNSVSP